MFEVEQSPSAAVLTTVKTLSHALTRPDILQHDDRDVRLEVVACIISEIMRITAPETPYTDDILRVTFSSFVNKTNFLSGICFNLLQDDFSSAMLFMCLIFHSLFLYAGDISTDGWHIS